MIRIFVTGGTFDKTYDEIHGRLTFDRTHLPEMLRLGRSRVEVAIESLMMIDRHDGRSSASVMDKRYGGRRGEAIGTSRVEHGNRLRVAPTLLCHGQRAR